MLILFNKPYGVLCQFTDRGVPPRRTLAEFIRETDVYPAGRLDFDCEGLLLLTDDGALRAPPDRSAPQAGQDLSRAGRGHRRRRPRSTHCAAASGSRTARPCRRRSKRSTRRRAWLWPRDPPVRFRKSVPDAWLRLTIREGRNRQVRRMTAAVGLPTLRLIRTQIGAYTLEDLAPGASRISA